MQTCCRTLTSVEPTHHGACVLIYSNNVTFVEVLVSNAKGSEFYFGIFAGSDESLLSSQVVGKSFSYPQLWRQFLWQLKIDGSYK